jgi:beta-lactamase regulating signal transducer with metallopeptidase domain
MWVYTLLPKILNMSLTAGVVIVLVLLARILLRKAPKIFSYALWSVVLFRLVCPVAFSSEFSLLGVFHAPVVTNGSITYIPADIVHTEYPQVDLPISGISKVINDNLPYGGEQTAADPLEWQMAAATMLWLGGIATMLIYSAASLLLLRRRLIGAVCLRENIYLSDHTATPFVIGVIRPKIYLPSSLTEQEQSYIILHEQTHIRRLDHISKMIAFLALAVHWFNPLVWAALSSCVKDMEMSCDERVLKEMGGGIKGAYSTSLLSLAAGRRLINGSPLAFGEGNIKGRIKNVMSFKKPGLWVLIVTTAVVVAAAMCLLTNPPKALEPTSPVLSLNQEVGADMAELDYASDDIVIFHGYFGLFVYDLNSKKIIRSLDLNPIGCTATQGDNYCDVTVSPDGNTVQLHPMNSKNMYVYTVSNNTLQETVYERMENRFADFVDIVDIVGYQNAGNYSHSAVKFDAGEYGYLHASDLTLGTLTYVRGGDTLYRLFDFGGSSSASALPAAESKTGKTDSVKFFVTTSPGKYTPAMSSTPGIRLDIAYDGPTAQILYEAETGGFITWQNSIIKDLGNSVTRPTGAFALYWRPNHDSPKDDVITFTILNEAGEKIAGSTFAITKGDGGFFTAVSKSQENVDLQSSSATIESWELISRAFAEALFEKNTEVMKSYLLDPDKGFHEYNSGNVLSDVESMKLKFSPDDIKSDLVSAQYEFTFDGDDSYTYLQISMKKVNDVWKIESYGLEK